MSAALKVNGTIILTNNSDFWELTNYGTNAVDLYGYSMSDSSEDDKYSLPGGFIQAGESIVFVRNRPTQNEAQFRLWWGACVGSNVQIRFYSKPGFSGNGDGIRVWDSYYNLVDSADFPVATRGISFINDPDTGIFGATSALDDGLTCQAETAPDIASPGRATPPIDLTIREHPTNATACLGGTAKFSVAAIGMPRPRYQWYLGASIIPFQNGPTLTITNVGPGNVGTYRVVIQNGLKTLQASNAILSLDTNASAPTFVVPLVDTRVAVGRTARLSTSVCAFPAPTFQWFANGVPIAGATSRTLLVPNCSFELSGTEYSLRAQNVLGTNTTHARLYVTALPDLRITELQAYPMTNCGNAHHDWFEVTNFGPEPVDLRGYRFNSKFSLKGSVTVTQDMLLHPRESAIFAKNPIASIFIDWWGAELLPPGLKVFPYAGFSLSKSGDTLYLWNAEAELREEAIDGISYASSYLGVSLFFDYDIASFELYSFPGAYGGFRALYCGDVGSPGYISNPPPRFVRITQRAEGTSVTWRANEMSTYQLGYKTALNSGPWLSAGSVTATGALATLIDPSSTNAPQRFYRVSRVTP